MRWLAACLASCCFVLSLLASASADDTPVKWERIKLEEVFRAEGVAIADINKDGRMDVVTVDVLVVQRMRLRELVVNDMLLELGIGRAANVLEPPHADVMRGAHQDVVVAIAIEVIDVNVRGGLRVAFAVSFEDVLVKHPRSVVELGRLFPPTVRNHDVSPAVTVHVTDAEAVVVAMS